MGKYLDIAEQTAVPPEPPPPATWDWLEHLTDGDLAYLRRPRKTPIRCAWCGGRYAHGRFCVTLCDEWAVKMCAGKYRGQPVRNIGTDYLRWALAKMGNLTSDVRDEIERVLRDRVGQEAGAR